MSQADKARIDELESALKKVVEYLGKLPLNLETARIANEAKSVLDNDCSNNKTPDLALKKITPSGFPTLEIALTGKQLYIKLNEVSSGTKIADVYMQQFLNGATFNLHEQNSSV